MKLTSLAVAILAVVSISLPAAASVSFTGSSGSRAASVTFDISGSNLLVTLTNTSGADVLVPTDVLTAIFFNAGTTTFSPVSATLHPGSSVFFGPDGGGNVGSEWAYKSALVGAPHSATQAISSTGVGLFGPADNFDTGNLQGPSDVDGLQYGITSAGDNTATGNVPVTGGFALIKNSVDFVLSFTGTFALTDIGAVSFQYGTALDEPNIPGGCVGTDCGGGSNEIPEPTSLLLAGLGLVGLGALRRGKKA